jgi:cell division protein FtsW (lipid II flippase)
MPLRRFLSFRDFDWALLGLVLLLCAMSVLEVHSATVHTKFASFGNEANPVYRRRALWACLSWPRSTITA